MGRGDGFKAVQNILFHVSEDFEMSLKAGHRKVEDLKLIKN